MKNLSVKSYTVIEQELREIRVIYLQCISDILLMLM